MYYDYVYSPFNYKSLIYIMITGIPKSESRLKRTKLNEVLSVFNLLQV